MRTSVICANHGRDTSKLVASLPPNVEYIEINQGLERSVQRNMAIRKATGDIIIWMDSDQSFANWTIWECQELIKSGCVAVYIPEMIIADSFFGKMRAFERTFYTGTAVDVPKAVLRKNFPFFNEELHGPEDADWSQRIPKGERGLTCHCIYHYDDIGFWDYCKKKAYYTNSMKRYAELNPNDKCLDLKYRCWTVFTEKGKWRELLKHPVLTLGIVFLLIIRGVIYARR